MTIKTKYSLGDTVWVMSSNKPRSFVVGQIKPGTVTTSNCHYNHYATYPDAGLDYAENLLYPTKEALLATL